MPTEKERVLEKWPDAGVDEMPGGKGYVVLCMGVFFTYSDIDDGVIGYGKTESKAWVDAAKRLETHDQR